MKMLKDKKFKILLMGGMFASVGWGIHVIAQAPAASTPAAAPVVSTPAPATPTPAAPAAAVATPTPAPAVQAPVPVAPTPMVTKPADWKPEQPAKDAKVGTWTAVDPGALNVALKIKKVSVGDTNDVWGVGEDNKIYQLTPKGWEARAIGIDVAAAEDETVIMVNDKNEVLKRNKKGGWDTIPNVKLSSVSVGNDDAIWGIYQGQVFHFDDGKWEKVKNMLGQDAKGLTYFSVNDEEIVYAIDDKNTIYRRDLDRVDLVKKTAGLRQKVVADKKVRAKKAAEARKARAKKPARKVAPRAKKVARAGKVARSARKVASKRAAKSAPRTGRAGKSADKSAPRRKGAVEKK